MGVSKNNGTPKSSILIGFSIINHPFWDTPIFGNPHILSFDSDIRSQLSNSWLETSFFVQFEIHGSFHNPSMQCGYFPPKKRYSQIINFNRTFHYKPSILRYPYFLETPMFVANILGMIKKYPAEKITFWWIIFSLLEVDFRSRFLLILLRQGGNKEKSTVLSHFGP